MKKIIVLILCFSQLSFAQLAPVFQEVHHFFYGDLTDSEDKVNYLFNGRDLSFPKKYGLTIAHQNREWDYNWFIVSMGIPTKIGAIGIGYSNYSSPLLPITAEDSIGAYIDEYGSDLFQSFLLSYQPNIEMIDAQILINHKRRRLITESASASGVDLQISSNIFLGNSVGLRTRNLLMSSYKWSDGSEEELPKYIGTYVNVPIIIKSKYITEHHFNFFFEYDHCINYSDNYLITTNAGYRFHESISLFATYRNGSFMKSLSIGTFLKISTAFSLGYSNQTEVYDDYDVYIHAVSIGVNF